MAYFVRLTFTLHYDLEEGTDGEDGRVRRQKNWQLWIPTQGINFALVPPHLRLVTVNVVSLLCVSLSSLIHLRAPADQLARIVNEQLEVRNQFLVPLPPDK